VRVMLIESSTRLTFAWYYYLSQSEQSSSTAPIATSIAGGSWNDFASPHDNASSAFYLLMV